MSQGPIRLPGLGFGGWKTAGYFAQGTRSTKGPEITAEALKAQKKD